MNNRITHGLKRRFRATYEWLNFLIIFALSRFKTFDSSEALMIFSDPRGGSTWLNEILGEIKGTTGVWEPLALTYGNRFRSIGFGWRQIIPETGQWPEAKRLFNSLLKGKLVAKDTVAKTSPLKWVRGERLLIKFCRGNNLLFWIQANFELKYKPVYLVRHPGAVIASQLVHPGWRGREFHFEIPDMPFNELYVEHSAFLKTFKHYYEWLAAIWCITNGELLKHRNSGKFIFITYENMVINPEKEIGRIFTDWNISISQSVQSRFYRASKTSSSSLVLEDNEAQLSKWMDFFSKVELERIQEILNYFKIDFYRIDNIKSPIK
jgi:hypothetical protein